MHAHLIFVTKYRRNVFDGDAIERLSQHFQRVANDFEARVVECNGEENHIHLLVEYVGDPPGEEVFQSVEYTLTNELGREVSPLTGRRKGTADCEDLSAAVVALGLALVALGLTPGLTLRNRWWNQPGAVQNHVAGEACDPTFVHEPCISVETTIPGALAGDDPYQALFRVGGDFRTRVFGADQIPYLTLT